MNTCRSGPKTATWTEADAQILSTNRRSVMSLAPLSLSIERRKNAVLGQPRHDVGHAIDALPCLQPMVVDPGLAMKRARRLHIMRRIPVRGPAGVDGERMLPVMVKLDRRPDGIEIVRCPIAIAERVLIFTGEAPERIERAIAGGERLLDRRSQP